MAIGAVLRSRSVAAAIFAVVWSLLGLTLVAAGWIGFRNVDQLGESARKSYLVVVVFGVLSLATAVTRLVPGRLFCVVGGATGVLAGLYGAALILLGSEDVGGLGVALPAGLSAIAFSAWALASVWRRLRDRRINVA